MGVARVTTRRYLPDANVVCYFQKAGQLELLAQALVRVPWLIVDAVEDELIAGKQRTLGEHAFRVLQKYTVHVEPMREGSREELLFRRLHPTTATKNKGEAASIAVATYDPSLIFVTHDSVALRLGVTELYSASGERCIHSSTFVRRLFEFEAISAAEVRHWRKCNPLGDMPRWWDEWVDHLHPEASV